ncbi:MAG: phenylalanine 4-monooxygenase, partial [Pseudomonadota bacterium]
RYAVEDRSPERRPFNLLDVLRTPFRIDTFQKIYYVIDSFDELFSLAYTDFREVLKQARILGDFRPSWEQQR